MSEKELAVRAAVFAISKLVGTGSVDFAIKSDFGRWETIKWSRVVEILIEGGTDHA